MGVVESRIRNTGDGVGFSKAAYNPALQQLARGAGGIARGFTARRAHRQQIVTGHHHRQAAGLLCVDGVRMIADMDNRRPVAQLFREGWPEQNELVQIGQPLCDEPSCVTKAAEKGPGLNQLRGNTGSGQSIQHHDRKALHALLAIERVITDQQNHRDDGARPSGHAAAQRNANAAAQVARDLAIGRLFEADPRAASSLRRGIIRK